MGRARHISGQRVRCLIGGCTGPGIGGLTSLRIIRGSWYSHACAVVFPLITGTGVWGVHDVTCLSVPGSPLLGHRRARTATRAIVRQQPRGRPLRPAGSAGRRSDLRIRIHIHHSGLDQLRTRRVGRIRLDVARNSCGRHAGAEALWRFLAWPFGAQLLGECPVVLTGSRLSSARSCREPPDLGAGLVRRSRCRCLRLPMFRAQLHGPGGLSGAAFRRGFGTACWIGRTVVMWLRLCSLRVGGPVLSVGGRGLLGGHAHVPPNRVRWVGPPDWVESRFGWVLPGCGIAVRPLPRLIHRRRFTVLC